MFALKIAEKLRPFCHQNGTECLIPYSFWKIKAFASLLEFTSLESVGKKETFSIDLDVRGPLKGFTVMLDLEKGGVKVFCEEFSLWITQEDKHILVELMRGKPLAYSVDGRPKNRLEKKEILQIDVSQKEGERAPIEKISFGLYKKQDFDAIRKRRDLAEYFPLLFRLGQMVPKTTVTTKSGMMKYIDDVELLFQAAFDNLLIPHLLDVHHYNLDIINKLPKNVSPLILLQEGYQKIRSFFFIEEKTRVSLLPFLPKKLHAGRMLGIKAEMGIWDIEWSKKRLRRAVFYAHRDGYLELALQPAIKTFRVQGKVVHQACQPLEILKGKRYFLDKFQK